MLPDRTLYWTKLPRRCAMKKTVLIISIFLVAFAHGETGNDNCAGITEDYGYIDVRRGAHMFYVTYHTELPGDWADHPLIMWLQGGPGSSSVGYGNFWLLGPCDINGNIREERWTQKANVLFVDNPVGTGYSYVDDNSYLTTTNAEIAEDLVALLKGIYKEHPDMERMPFFIYSESYGGKMAIDFSLLLLQAFDNGEINVNLQGVVLGDAWISPIDYVNTWGPYLYEMGFVNEDGLKSIDERAAKTQKSVDNGEWQSAYRQWSLTQQAVFKATGGIDFYNIHAEDSSFYNPAATTSQSSLTDENDIVRQTLGTYAGDPLDTYMNGEQKEKWDIPDTVVWGGQSGSVFSSLSSDFMKPVVTSVVEAIELDRIHVAVYNGNLDLICDTPGTYLWIKNMKFATKDEYDSTMRVNMYIDDYPNTSWYYQRNNTFSVNTFLRAGHMMPLDNPKGALQLVDKVTIWGRDAAMAYKSRKAAEKRLTSFVVEKAVDKLNENITLQPVDIKQVDDAETKMPAELMKEEPSENKEKIEISKVAKPISENKIKAIHKVHSHLRGRKVPLKHL